jgi:hypothetical protein
MGLLYLYLLTSRLTEHSILKVSTFSCVVLHVYLNPVNMEYLIISPKTICASLDHHSPLAMGKESWFLKISMVENIYVVKF